MTNTEPVASAGAITAVIESGLLMLIGLGVLDISDNQMHAIMSFVIAIAGVIGPIWWARSKTTPLAKPVDEDGVTPLVRSDGALPRAQARSLAK